jgi:hypothetical protein
VCPTVKPVGEPDAGNPHVRFDERGGKRDDARVATAPNPDSTENKGPVFHRSQRSWNVVENKDSYSLKAGMLCAPQRRGSPVGGSPTQIVVGKSGS